MNFKESKAIYLQIADRICDEILLGQFGEEERIPSVREYAAIVEVNANTVMRSFDYLQSQNIIYNKRGIGYFVAPGARELIHSLRKDIFLKEELDYFCLGKPYFSNQINLQGEQLVQELPTCRVIWMTQTEMNTEERGIWLANSLLGVLPSKGEKNTFSCSEKVNEYLKMTVMGDTLKIVLDYSLIDFPQEFKESKYVGMITGDMQLNLTSKVECVINDIYMQKIALKKLTKDSISIDTPNSIMVDSCDFRALSVIRGGRNVEFQSGNINNLHLNLNRMNNWSVNVEECHIDTEYLTGQNASVQLQKGECRRMFWIPEKDDSKLKVTLTEKACVTVME